MNILLSRWKSLKINVITPAKKHSKNGNRATAKRWAHILRNAGHSVQIDVEYSGGSFDLMIAIHAWRSAASINAYLAKHPGHPLIVGLGGTDVNTYMNTHSAVTIGTMEKADALICLHGLIAKKLPDSLVNKLYLVRQSAIPLSTPQKLRTRTFDVCVVGHLREEKDPFRTAMAAKLIYEQSKLRVTHFGKAHSQAWARDAEKHMRETPRYIWRGEVARWQVRREFAYTRAMVISSKQEGGANVVSEAIVAGVPIIASDIDGNVGLLGEGYPGYFPLGDERALARVLWRSETDPTFLPSLAGHINELKPLFVAEKESADLLRVVDAVTRST
jgi:putative glycosyltransferase (TIGR04348 family)